MQRDGMIKVKWMDERRVEFWEMENSPKKGAQNTLLRFFLSFLLQYRQPCPSWTRRGSEISRETGREIARGSREKRGNARESRERDNDKLQFALLKRPILFSSHRRRHFSRCKESRRLRCEYTHIHICSIVNWRWSCRVERARVLRFTLPA